MWGTAIRWLFRNFGLQILFSVMCLILFGLIYLLALNSKPAWKRSQSDLISSTLFNIPRRGALDIKTNNSMGFDIENAQAVELYWQLVSQGVGDPNADEYPTRLSRDSIWSASSERQLGTSSDRVIQQLVSTFEFMKEKPTTTVKKVLLLDSFEWWNFNSTKIENSCPGIHSRCEFLNGPLNYFSTYETFDADAVVAVRDYFHQHTVPVRKNVTRLFVNMESPFHSSVSLTRDNDLLASYWEGSDIVVPYGKWVYYNASVQRQVQRRNFARGKHKSVAIFASNCNTPNNRMEYIKQLQQNIQVDIYGKCGNLDCPRSTKSTDECFTKLKRHYKFYLSFENSNCRNYITEKLFENAYRNNIVPIVMGGHPDDYKVAMPYKSYIHVDDFKDPAELAEYLKYLITHDDKYNKYFEWKGTGRFIQTESICRFCAILHLRGNGTNLIRKEPFQWNEHNRDLCLPRNKIHWKESSRPTPEVASTDSDGLESTGSSIKLLPLLNHRLHVLMVILNMFTRNL